MRKSDKKENFKRVNLIVENRFLESKGIIKESYHDEYTKYEKIMYIGEPKTFSNGKTVKYGDIGEYIGTEGGEECWVSFPTATGFATSFSNIKKYSLNEYESSLTTKDELIRVIDGKLEEIKNGKNPKEVGIGTFLAQLKQEDTNLFDEMIEKYKDVVRLAKPDLDENFFNRFFDISSKENEANKKKAIDEIVRFNFQSLFFQPGEGQVLRKDIAERIVADAARVMPTVKQLNTQLFELKDGYFSNATMKINDKLYRGFIPSCFEFIRGQHDLIDNETAKGKLQGYLN